MHAECDKISGKLLKVCPPFLYLILQFQLNSLWRIKGLLFLSGSGPGEYWLLLPWLQSKIQLWFIRFGEMSAQKPVCRLLEVFVYLIRRKLQIWVYESTLGVFVKTQVQIPNDAGFFVYLFIFIWLCPLKQFYWKQKTDFDARECSCGV